MPNNTDTETALTAWERTYGPATFEPATDDDWNAADWDAAFAFA